MARRAPRHEKTVLGNGHDTMKVEKGYNAKKINTIAKASQANSVKDASSYLRVPCYRNKDNFICEIINDVAFYAGCFGKKYFRLYEMAVSKEAQRKGYGTLMITRIKVACQARGLQKITLRTSKTETAIEFYRKHNGVIVGENNGDWEVEIPI